MTSRELKIIKMRERVKEFVKKEQEERKSSKYTPPRYDEEFWEGVRWLNSLDGEDLPEFEGTFILKRNKNPEDLAHSYDK